MEITMMKIILMRTSQCRSLSSLSSCSDGDEEAFRANGTVYPAGEKIAKHTNANANVNVNVNVNTNTNTNTNVNVNVNANKQVKKLVLSHALAVHS